METNKNVKKQSSTAKELNSQLKIIEGKIDAKKSEVSNTQKDLALLQKQADGIKTKLQSLATKDRPAVSEHAMLRYMERIMGMDIKQVEMSILNDSITKMISELGNGTYPHHEGFKVVVKNNVIVTILHT